MPRHEPRSVAGVEAIGPYTLVRVTRGGLDPGVPGQFFMLEAPGRVLPRPMSLCLAPRGELAFLIDPIGPGTRALAALEPGDEIAVFGPLGNGFRLDVPRPLLVGGGIGIAPLPYLSEALDRPPAVLGFRSEHHAEAAALVPNAEVVIDPVLVTDVLPAGPRRARLRARADARGGARDRAGGPARLGGADGLRLRRLLRLRGRGRRATRAALRGRARCSPLRFLLNASGCLDALTAPETARQLDAFVTKTVTPEPREGNPPVRIAETGHGMLNAIGLANPGRERFLAETLPALRALGVPLWVSVGGFSAERLRRDVRAPRGRHGRAQPLVPERRRGAGVGGGDRRRVSCGHRAAALREALAGGLGHRRGRARGRGGRRRRALARQHDSRPRPRRPAAAEPRPRDGRLLGSGAEADRARRCLRLPARHDVADRRHGRRPDRP